MDTATHTDETGLVIEYEQQQSMDIQLPVAVNIILLVTWLLLCGAGLAVILLQKNFWAGLFIIGVPTILGMIVKPTFALVLVMLILPTGAGVGYAQSFSLDRGIGIALALSFLLNIMVTRPRLHLSHKVLWVILLYSFWIFLSPLGSPHPFVELRRVFTQFQLVAFALIIYWILERNGEYSLRWVLRSYVLGTLGMIAITFFTGAAITSIEETSQERYTATVGGMIDANALAAIVALAFLSAVYLIVRDKNLLWRLMYCTALLILPVMLLKIGSRGALIALAFTLMSPLLFIRQVSQKPTLVLALLMVIVLASLAVGLARSRQMLTEGVEQRLTDVHYAKKSIDYRIGLMKACVNSAINRPVLGSSFTGWLERSGMR
ncbi:MAG: O-antigen ligase family protein, partial [Bacteroidetes bacterium]|nr:O-antigen ligase family protein [Bacteroidota bacterium]